MKPSFVIGAVVAALLAAPFLSAQQVEPTSLLFQAVPGYTSPRQGVVFQNTGDTELPITLSISGPFSIPKNGCGKMLRPGLRCNVYVTYTPEAVETDNGTLTFTFNSQTVSVSLTGTGLASIPTRVRLHAPGQGRVGVPYTFTIYVTPLHEPGLLGYTIPDGEQAYGSCVSNKGDSLNFTVTMQREKGSALAKFDYPGEWACSASYNGDAEFGASSIQLRNRILVH